jgi:anthranilate phosphoribosyltransferase
VRTVRDPRDAGIERCTLDDLRGADAASNAARLREALAGRDTAAHRDALALNAALALEVTGAEPDARSAVARARKTLANGGGSQLLERIAAFAQDHAATAKAPRDQR